MLKDIKLRCMSHIAITPYEKKTKKKLLVNNMHITQFVLCAVGV